MKPILLRLVIAALIVFGFAVFAFYAPPSGIPVLK